MFNWYPARVFMGDAGSLFLGFLIAAATLKVKFVGDNWNRLSAILLLLAPACLDTLLVVIARARSRRPIYVGATDHTSHRLLRLGLRTPTVALVLAAAAAVLASLGLLIGRGLAPLGVVAPLAGAGVALALVLLLGLPDSGAAVGVKPNSSFPRNSPEAAPALGVAPELDAPPDVASTAIPDRPAGHATDSGA
jgi:hypothetical protein